MKSSSPAPWVLWCERRPEARARLFCFPYAGTGASIFRRWSRALPPTVEVCPVQLPGRENRLRETPFTRLAPLVQEAAHALTPYLDKPFAFFGHSMGALVSFELARRLRHDGLSPFHLFVSGCCSPQIPDPDPPLHALPEREFLEQVRLLNGTPDGVLEHRELVDLVLPSLRADFAVCETYASAVEPSLNCAISAFGGLQDPKVRRDHLEAWRHETTGSFELQMLPGDHFFLHTAETELLMSLKTQIGSH